MEMLTPKTLTEVYIQGGALLLLIVLLVLALIATWRIVVKTLWTENKDLRQQVMDMNERVAKMGEASRQTNETTNKALIEQSAAFRDLISAWRSSR